MVVMVNSNDGCLQRGLVVFMMVMVLIVIMKLVVMMVMMMMIIMWWLIAMMGAPSKAVGRREILTMGHYAPFMDPAPLGQNRVKFLFCISHLMC